jgi:hypothetical protein
LEGQYLIQASFNFIIRTIKHFEVLDRKNLGTIIIAKEVWSMQQLAIELLHESPSLKIDPSLNHYHPQCSGLIELVRAKNDARDAKLNAEEVRAFVEVFTRFPRNIMCNKRKKTKEPYLRLMTATEKKRVLRPEDLCLNSAFLNKRMFARFQKQVEGNIGPSTPEEAERVLSDMVLRYTPNLGGKTEEHGSATFYCVPDNQTPDATAQHQGAPMQDTVVSFILFQLLPETS